MLSLTEAEKEKLLEDVRQEFPDDEMMQEIHYSRLLHYFQTKDLPPHERVKYFSLLEKSPYS
jgi:hypothetical protein